LYAQCLGGQLGPIFRYAGILAARFGIFVDRFGIQWLINCEAPRA
jgi:hypothetical protein